MKNTSAVEFVGRNRIHIGLGVSNLERSVEFYRVLFDQEPTKVRKGYAKFEVESPPVNLSLNEVMAESPLPYTQELHYGIQVKSTEDVSSAMHRFSEAKLEMAVEEEVHCCYAVQSKVWVTDPDGNKWEVFVVLVADAEKESDKTRSECCAGVTGGETFASNRHTHNSIRTSAE